MNCTEFLDNYSAWVDGDADSEWGDRAAVHALTCESCSQFDAVYRRGRELLVSSADELEVDEDAFRASLELRIVQSRNLASANRTLGSGAPLMSLLAMTMVVLSVAWVPVLIQLAGPTVDLSPIQARRPDLASNGLSIRLPIVRVQSTRAGYENAARFRPAATFETRTLDSGSELWSRPEDLLRQYAPVMEPYRAGARPGVD